MAKQELLLRPLLSMAVFCERVLKEADGVLSAIRIIDRITVVGATEDMPPTSLRLQLLLGFKSGMMRGPARVRINPAPPSELTMPTIEFPLLFEGDDDRGAVVVADLNFLFRDQGLYWFDVELLGETVTRIPLRVVYQKTGQVIHGS